MRYMVWCHWTANVTCFPPMYILQIRVDGDMVEDYTRRVIDHAFQQDNDAGFEILCRPTTVGKGGVIRSGIRCAAYEIMGNQYRPTAFYLYERSVMSDTPLRTIHTNIVEAGYRGELTVPVDNISDGPFEIKKCRRLFRICMPDLKPFKVRIVQTFEDMNPDHEHLDPS